MEKFNYDDYGPEPSFQEKVLKELQRILAKLPKLQALEQFCAAAKFGYC